MIPNILNELVNDLKNNTLLASENINGEGRHGSLIDEGNIVNFLEKHAKWGKYVKDVKARGFGDFILTYDNVTYVINIKSTNGSTDNATSKIGFLWAFTDIPYDEMPKSISLKKWEYLMRSRKCSDNNRDYWFLVFDKKDMNNIFIRGCKQIVNWSHNPTNLLQINWKKEWNTDYPNYTFEQSWDNVYNGMKACIFKNLENLPWVVDLIIKDNDKINNG